MLGITALYYSQKYQEILRSFQHNYVSNELKLYFMKRNELSMEQGCLLWGYRVVIPPKFQHVLLKELHNEHSGISQTKSFARSYMWWPNMDICIEEMISGCLICQSVRNNPLCTLN